MMRGKSVKAVHWALLTNIRSRQARVGTARMFDQVNEQSRRGSSEMQRS